MGEGQLDHVTLAMRDRQQAREFYRATMSALGWVERVDPFGRVEYGEDGRCDFGFYTDPGTFFQQSHIAFRARSRAQVDRFYQAGLAHGGGAVDEPRERPEFGLYSAYLTDPDGNELEIAYHLSSSPEHEPGVDIEPGADAPAPLPITGLDHVVIGVSDWSVATAFYRDVIGAEVIPVEGDRVSFRVGATQLNVHGPGVDLTDNVARLPVRPGNSDLCFHWAGSVEDAVAHLARHGVAVETGPVERPGARGRGVSLYFRDPDGSLLEFITYA